MTIGPKTRALMAELLALKSRLSLSAEGIRDRLNESYLDKKISLGAVRRWLQNSGSPSSECVMALQAFISDNKRKFRKTKP